MIYSPYGLMRYNNGFAIVDDIPLLSQWIKKSTCRNKSIFWWGMVDSLRCGEATAVATVHRTVAKSRLSNPPPKYPYQNKKHHPFGWCFLFWWGMVDSNHRRHSQQIYSLSPLATREIPHIQLSCRLLGAGRRTRTPDLLITNQLLYQLSYTGGSNRTRLL